MSTKTNIEWTGSTWNPIAAFLRRDLTINGKLYPKGTRGWLCTKISPGCANCYAERINMRLGNGLAYVRVSLEDIEWRIINLAKPLCWRKPRKIFVCSMCDLFHESIPDHIIDQVFAVMALAERHTFQVLTKRPARMRDYLRGCDNGSHVGTARPRILQRMAGLSTSFVIPKFPLSNVWLGTSVENQEVAARRIQPILETPAAIRFLSVEPLLGPLDLRRLNSTPFLTFSALAPSTFVKAKVDWVIVGGESGPGARPMRYEWAVSLRDQCQAAGVPFFFKQWGEWAPADMGGVPGIGPFDSARKWPAKRVGKKKSGRELDGRMWSEYPAIIV